MTPPHAGATGDRSISNCERPLCMLDQSSSMWGRMAMPPHSRIRKDAQGHGPPMLPKQSLSPLPAEEKQNEDSRKSAPPVERLTGEGPKRVEHACPPRNGRHLIQRRPDLAHRSHSAPRDPRPKSSRRTHARRKSGRCAGSSSTEMSRRFPGPGSPNVSSRAENRPERCHERSQSGHRRACEGNQVLVPVYVVAGGEERRIVPRLRRKVMRKRRKEGRCLPG